MSRTGSRSQDMNTWSHGASKYPGCQDMNSIQEPWCHKQYPGAMMSWTISRSHDVKNSIQEPWRQKQDPGAKLSRTGSRSQAIKNRIQKPSELKLESNLQETQVAFGHRRCNRDCIFKMRNSFEKCRECHTDLHSCFIDQKLRLLI